MGNVNKLCNCRSLICFALLIFFSQLSAQTFEDRSSLLQPANNNFEWGTTAADFNNDGLVDIYERDKVYLNMGEEGFVNIIDETNMDQGQSTFGAVFGDYNNDGYLDILFENFGPESKLNRNERNGTFKYVNQEIGLTLNLLTQTCGWSDFNQDGTLDLWLDDDNGNNVMLKNINHEFFQNISGPAGAPTPGNSYGMSWGDFNNDGMPDVFIATCPGGFKNHLLRNEGDETFTNIGEAAGVDDTNASWGSVWIDYNCDGLLDVYIANSGDPNVLYENMGDETFQDVSSAAGVSSGGGFGTAILDFDNDGWPDIYSTSGSLHKLYKNNGDGTFTNVAEMAGIVATNHDAVAIADFNNDGWMDIFTAGSPSNKLMFNTGTGTNHWIKINTRSTIGNFFGLGARIEIWTAGHRQIKDVTAGDSFCSQNDLLRSHFGLGEHATIDSIIVKWISPQSTVDKFYDVPADQHITIVEGIGINNSPAPFTQISPMDGEVFTGLNNFVFEWEQAVDPEGQDITYRVYITGTNFNEEYTVVNQTSLVLDAELLVAGADYNWVVDATDGYSIQANTEVFTFEAQPEIDMFDAVLSGPVVEDAGYSEGSAWGDYDGDGDEDLFVTNILDQDNFLYQNDGNGVFTAVSEGPMVTDGGQSSGATWVDYDNDGDLDLYVYNRSQANSLYVNDGGVFSKATSGVIIADTDNSWSGSWADVDNDGDLDLFVANWNEANALYENLGGGEFSKLTSGSIVTDVESSIGHVWFDYDGDNDLDLFVANANFSSGQNNSLYRNDGALNFSKITGTDMTSSGGNSVAASFGDYDNDGDADLFVTNYFDENNFFYENNGDGSFTTESISIMVNDGGYSVGSSWSDIDNDGDLDLWVSDDNETGDNSNRLYENLAGVAFQKVTSGVLVTAQNRSNSGIWSDIDGDGDIDLFVANGNSNPPHSNFLFMNQANTNNNWLGVSLEGVQSNRFGIGATIEVKTLAGNNEIFQMQTVSTQNGYNSQNSMILHFGLASADLVESIVIYWPSGIVQTVDDVEVNQTIKVIEEFTVGIEDEQVIPTEFALEPNYPNPFNPSTTIKYSLPQAATVHLAVYNVLGQQIRTLVNGFENAGVLEVVWDGRDESGTVVQTGIYFYRFETSGFIATRKMIMMK